MSHQGQPASAESTVPNRSRRMTWMFRLMVPPLTVAFVVMLVEIYLRVTIPSPTVSLFCFRTDTQRTRVMKPNIRGHVYGVPIETNEQGFRAQRPYTVSKAADVRRVVVLGDSMTVCAGLPFEAVVTTRLEQRMNAAAPGVPIEVYSLACGSHGVLHHLATVKEVALPYKPDLILLLLFPWNDFDVEMYDRERDYAAQHAQGNESIPTPGSTERWFERPLVYKAFSSPLAHVLWRAGIIERYQGLVETARSRSPAWQRCTDALAEIVSLTRQAGVTCAAFNLPGTSTSFDAQREVDQATVDACRSVGLPAYTLLDAFSATGKLPRQFRINAIDGHPSGDYCAVAAEAILEHLRTSGAFDRLLAAGERP